MRHAPFIFSVALVAATALDVTLATPLTSETASVGNAWTGSTRSAVIDGRNLIPAPAYHAAS